MAYILKKSLVIKAFQFGVEEYPEWFKKVLTETESSYNKKQSAFLIPPGEWNETDSIVCLINGSTMGTRAVKGDYIAIGEDGVIHPHKKEKFENLFKKINTNGK